jgi:hypothetical protein
MLLRHAALRTTLDRNGIVPADSSVDLGGFPRLSPAAYQYVTLSLAGLATAISLYRTYLRLSRFRRLDLDDFLLLFATATVIGAAVYGVTLKDLIYQQVYVSLGAEPITVAILDNIPSYARSLDVAGGAQWFSIYGTKVCYLLFFRKLGDRVRGLRAWRWGVTTLVIVSGLLSVFLVIYVCPASSAEEIYGKSGLVIRPPPALTASSRFLPRRRIHAGGGLVAHHRRSGHHHRPSRHVFPPSTCPLPD